MTVPVEFTDPINAKILEVSEDRVQGFQRDPLGEIARLSGVEQPVVIERIHAMLRAGNIRRVRQTLLATNLAQGALVAWQVPDAKLNAAFDWMFQQDPFSGHVLSELKAEYGYRLVYEAQSFPSLELAAIWPELTGDRRLLTRVRRQELYCLMNADLVLTGSPVTRRFIHSLGANAQSSAIVEAITALGKSLSVPITAEGVETEAIREQLAALGCSDAQGWYFGRAVSGHVASMQFKRSDEPAPTLPATVNRASRTSGSKW